MSSSALPTSSTWISLTLPTVSACSRREASSSSEMQMSSPRSVASESGASSSGWSQFRNSDGSPDEKVYKLDVAQTCINCIGSWAGSWAVDPYMQWKANTYFGEEATHFAFDFFPTFIPPMGIIGR